MKIKFSFIIFMTVLLLGIFITNCTDDDKEETLIGTWVLTKMKISYTGYDVEVDPAEMGYYETLTIRDDNSFTHVITDEGETTTINGTWATSGKKIFYTVEGETEELDYNLKGDTLEISGVMTIGDLTATIVMVYTRQ